MNYDSSEPPIKKNWFAKLVDLDPFVIIILFLAILVTIFGILCYDGIKEEVKEEVKVEAKVEQVKEMGPTENDLTLTDAYAALFRAYKTKKICYVEESNGYFIHFSKKDTDDEVWDGWFYVKGPTFYRNKANGTWFIFNIPDRNFDRVWPNVDDMNCGEANDYEGK